MNRKTMAGARRMSAVLAIAGAAAALNTLPAAADNHGGSVESAAYATSALSGDPATTTGVDDHHASTMEL
ncbi:hypothetical protein I5Q34_13455 [Streptomyces sp. AV19]|uniref:hypothetical protein n=1 Tax=Streptomyces sp. AV19 TaxID=2793068 RepID=UPI0018FEA3C1|nr:hypothetical protein [Streptomyces sp. AV19]MBH1935266.1 hypothetical protein [Streptomyces sp. AV19]MDG4531153.1 hypothetical protein [Streptomyces sp. AV19]